MKYLDKRNEQLAEEGLTLHPTNGYRKISIKKSKAATVTDMLKKGRNLDTRQIREFINA